MSDSKRYVEYVMRCPVPWTDLESTRWALDCVASLCAVTVVAMCVVLVLFLPLQLALTLCTIFALVSPLMLDVYRKLLFYRLFLFAYRHGKTRFVC